VTAYEDLTSQKKGPVIAIREPRRSLEDSSTIDPRGEDRSASRSPYLLSTLTWCRGLSSMPSAVEMLMTKPERVNSSWESAQHHLQAIQADDFTSSRRLVSVLILASYNLVSTIGKAPFRVDYETFQLRGLQLRHNAFGFCSLVAKGFDTRQNLRE
jgi:hypothetical protein